MQPLAGAVGAAIREHGRDEIAARRAGREAHRGRDDRAARIEEQRRAIGAGHDAHGVRDGERAALDVDARHAIGVRRGLGERPRLRVRDGDARAANGLRAREASDPHEQAVRAGAHGDAEVRRLHERGVLRGGVAGGVRPEGHDGHRLLAALARAPRVAPAPPAVRARVGRERRERRRLAALAHVRGGRDERAQLLAGGHAAVEDVARGGMDGGERERGLRVPLVGEAPRGDADLRRVAGAAHRERRQGAQRLAGLGAEADHAHLVDLIGLPLALDLDEPALGRTVRGEVHAQLAQRRRHADVRGARALEARAREQAERRPDVDHLTGRLVVRALPGVGGALGAGDALHVRAGRELVADDARAAPAPRQVARRERDPDARAGLERAPEAHVDAEGPLGLRRRDRERERQAALAAADLVGEQLRAERGQADRRVEEERQRRAGHHAALRLVAQDAGRSVEDDDALELIDERLPGERGEPGSEGEAHLARLRREGLRGGREGDRAAARPARGAAHGGIEDEGRGRELAADVGGGDHGPVEAHPEGLVAAQAGGSLARREHREPFGRVRHQERCERRRGRQLVLRRGPGARVVEEPGRDVAERGAAALGRGPDDPGEEPEGGERADDGPGDPPAPRARAERSGSVGPVAGRARFATLVGHGRPPSKPRTRGAAPRADGADARRVSRRTREGRRRDTPRARSQARSRASSASRVRPKAAWSRWVMGPGAPLPSRAPSARTTGTTSRSVLVMKASSAP